MKRFLMLVAVATVAGAIYVAAAPGSRQATPPTAAQFAALKKQVASLNKKLKALTKDEKSVKTLAIDAGGFISTCFLSNNAGVAPVTQFGDTANTPATYGFEYLAPGVPAGTSPTPRTGLDLDTGTTPQGFLQAVDPSCVSSGAASRNAPLPGTRLPLRGERFR